MSTKRIIGVTLLAAGIIMLIYGFKAKDSLENKISETFSGTPSDNTKWLLIGGTVCSLAGLALTVFKK